MFHSRKLIHRINSIHERALRVIYQDCKSRFLELLQRHNTVRFHDISPESLPRAYAQKQITLYLEMLKLPITALSQTNI